VVNGVDIAGLPSRAVLEYGTAGGAISMYVARKACKVSIIEPDRVGRG